MTGRDVAASLTGQSYSAGNLLLFIVVLLQIHCAVILQLTH